MKTVTKEMVFIPGAVYRWKRGKSTVEKMGKYKFLRATHYNTCPQGDCWIIDSEDNIHPGYENSPIPVDINDVVLIKDFSHA